MALALYRRYRPDTFDGVIGQDQVTIPLMRALDAGKLTHAYLFSGPRGCGKTSSARILARCINCAKGPTSHPCGECASCKDLATGGPGSIDVVEIDAASHNGVDDARELRERAGFAPARDRYKIFILDEAHMVTQQGFNALLKIVEEPPEHVMFIFATTEPDKVIGTIRSRTHHYPFRLVPAEIMGPYLETICEKESIKPEPGVLKLAMRAGGGSVRDTLSVLDQLMVGAVDGVISHDSAVALLGFTPETLIGEAVDAVIDRNGEALYGVIQKVVVGGFDPRRFVEDLLARVRDLLVLTLAGERAESVMSDTAEGEDMADLQRQASALGLAALTAMADTINTTLGAMTGAISPRMRLELLAARLLASREGALTAAGSGFEAGGASAPSAEGRAVKETPAAFLGEARATASQQSAAVGRPQLQDAGARSATGGASEGRASAHSGFAGASRNQHIGFAGAARNLESSAVESESQSESQEGSSVRSPSQSAADSPFSRGARENGSSVPSSPSSAGVRSATGETSTQPAQATSAPIEESPRTPDEKWDALVAALPADVRRYVDRTRVPKILFTEDPAHPRLWIKFDKPLNKYAFALAVATEAVDGTTSVVAILRSEVHKTFGANVSLAPTKKMANGSAAPAFKDLPADEQQRIKAQLLQESLKSATLAAQSSAEAKPAASGKEPESQAAPAATGESSSADDDDVHRTSPAQPSAAIDGDPWSQPAASTPPAAQSPTLSDDEDPWNQPAVASSTRVQTSTPAVDDDPWAVSSDNTNGGTAVASAHRDAADQPEHHHKHVAVPDMSDDTDPWAQPVQPQRPAEPSANDRDQTAAAAIGDGPAHGSFPVGSPAANANPTTSIAADDDPWNQPIPLPTVAPPDDDPWSRSAQSAPQQSQPTTFAAGNGPSNAANANDQPVVHHFDDHRQPIDPQYDVDPWGHPMSRPAGPANGGPVGNGPAAMDDPFAPDLPAGIPTTPQVDPDEDEYSMSDQSLGTATAMSIDELTKFFDVKKVEEFKADDPKNPRNLAQANKYDD
ncbi:DNA polymerase III subunit gamma/tau [Bifidobacterium biavatii]|uniref:DNA-directed DNA polymerase n=1 Tax=Bifidobacterium biavatii DSM 23969 TaxID=1437608 RepID=A0A086ZN73_9BIFI|nr:DNA polymerase III subunit gamma/tau [Bifidobacterium biavatii]KFI47973.1 DNA polymerase III subunit gamma/tau [Bifidobacterium biavatii DSM 23969]